jgi:hypothetical protein
MKKPKIKSAPPDPPFGLNMPFDEALRRFVATDPAELEANVKRSKKKKPSGRKKKVPSDGKIDQTNIVSLRHERMAKRNNSR